VTRARAAIAALACSLALGSYASAFGATQPYDQLLVGAARAIEGAANKGAPVPDVHIPPAPLGGPPRFSPSLDDWLQRSLAAARKTKRGKERAAQLRTIAASLRYVAAGTKTGAAAPGTDVESAVRSVLAQPAYRVAKTAPAQAPQPTIWERILEWIYEKLNDLFGRLAEATQGVPYVGTILAYAIVALAIGGLAFVGYRIARRIASGRVRRIAGIGEPLPPRADPDALYALALAHARRGQAAQAVALAYQAALVILDRSDRVAYDASRTAGEYRRLVSRKTPAIAAFFDPLARLFVAAAFADGVLVDEDWERAASAYSRIRDAISAREAA
jgi:uncharacterized protein DUF4129